MSSADPPTIQDVAREAGVSKATVSRVLNGCRNTSGRARDRVEQAVRKLHYQPNTVARQQAGLRWKNPQRARERGVIAVLRLDQRLEVDLEDACRTVAETYGYSCRAEKASAGDLKHQLQVLWAEGVQGLVIRAEQGTFPLLPEPWKQKFPHVLVGGHPGYTAPHVAFDFSEAVRMGYQEFTRRGCRRVGFMMVEKPGRTPDQRAIGAVLALARTASMTGTGPEAELFCVYPEETRTREILDWIEVRQPEGLVTTRFLLDRVGERLTVPTMLFEAADPGSPHVIAGLGFSLEALHTQATWMLINRMERQAGPRNVHVMIEPELVLHQALGNPTSPSGKVTRAEQ